MVVLVRLTLVVPHTPIYDSGAQKQLGITKEGAQECFAKMADEGLLRKVNMLFVYVAVAYSQLLSSIWVTVAKSMSKTLIFSHEST